MKPSEIPNKKLKGWILQGGVIRRYVRENIPKEAVILDIGSGGGHFILSCKEDGYKNLFATDLANFLQFPELKDVVTFKAANLNSEPLPFGDNTFDLVTSFHTFEHLENPFYFSREVHRVLKPGGTFILAFPYAWSIQSKIKFLLTNSVFHYRAANSHINFLIQDVFLKCFDRKKFRMIATLYGPGKLKLPGITIGLPANKYFANSVCYIMEKNYDS